MATIHWTKQVNGDFSNAADWGGGAVPGPSDNAVLDAAGSAAYTVTASTSQSVNSIQTATTATLSITGGTFAAAAGTGSGGNTGSILVGDGTVFDVGGAMNNSGLVAVNSTGDTTELVLTANTTFSGAGHLTLTDNNDNYIFGAAITTTLTNKDNTISGAGNIGDGQMTLVNQKSGVIDATGANSLTLSLGGTTLLNAGLLEATGAGGLFFGTETVNDSGGGSIKAGAGSFVNITNADIVGGTLQSIGTGVVKLTGSATLDASSVMSLSGNLNVGDGSVLTVKGAFTDKAVISIGSTGDTTEMVLSANTTLSGAGQVTLSDNSNNYIFASAATDVLVNVDNTISGAGNIGDNQMSLANQKAGVINATGANTLTIVLGGQALTNAGLLEGTGAGGLTIASAVVDNTAGAIAANANSAVTIESSTVSNAGGGGIGVANGAVGTLEASDIIGGALTVAGTGAFRAIGGASELDGSKSAVSLNGPLSINDGATMGLAGSIINSGRISIDSTGDTTVLTVDANTTLSGGGQVVIGDSTANYVLGAAAADALVNVDNTISGAGNLGDGQLTLVNEAAGVINALGANALIINTGGQTVINGGLIEATGAGGLTVQSASVSNTGGTIKANSGSILTLSNADIIGGSVISQGAGAVAAAGTDEFDGRATTVNLSGAIRVLDGSNLQLAGSITNAGAISISSTGDTTILTVAANTTLSGAGSVTLSDNSNNYVQGAAGNISLVNVNNTISGAGHIGNGQMTLVNQAAGVINAVGVNTLTINTGGQTATNLGLIEATGTGGLFIQSTTVANAGAIIRANTGSLVTLNNADIAGGTLATQGTGGFATSGSAELDGTGSTVTLAGPLLVLDGNVLYLAGAIANGGTITLAGTGDTTELQLAANTTLSGGGRITLSDNSNNYIFGQGSTTSLNNVDNTLSGSGHLGDGQMTLANQKSGIINASGANSLAIDTGSNTVVNAGLIETTGAGGMTINSPISNSGTLLAHTATLTIVGPLTNVVATTLTGGTYEADAGAILELPQNTGIVTDKATIVLSGSGSTIEAFNTTSGTEVAIDATLTTVAASGELALLAGRNWTTKSAMSNAGLLQLGGGTFAAKSLTNTGTTTGFGSITAPLTNSGVLSVQTSKTLNLGALTNLSGTTLTGGTYIVGTGATLQLAKNVSIVTLNATIDLTGVGATMQSLNTATSSQVTVDSSLATIGATGVLEVLGGRSYTTANAIANSGSLQLGGGVFTTGTLTEAAGSTLSGFGTVASVFSDAGAVVSSGGALAFTGTGDTFAGAVVGTEVDFAGGADALNSGVSLGVNTLGVSGGVTVTFGTSLSFGGVLVDGTGTTLSFGANTLTLTGSGSTIAGSINGTASGALVFGAGSQTLNAGAAISAPSWSLSTGDTTSVATNMTFAGTFGEAAGASLSIASGDTLGFTGAVTLAGTTNGAGTLSQTGGSEAINSGAVLGVGTWTLKSGAAVTVGESLAFGGSLVEDTTSSITIGAGDTLTTSGSATFAGTLAGTGALALAAGANAVIGGTISFGGGFSEAPATLSIGTGDSLALKGVSTFAAGAVANGAGVLSLSNATVSGLTIGGTLTLTDAGVVDQIGSITLGDATSAAAKLTIGKGDSYKLDGDVGIARGNAATSAITVTGTLIKSAGTGVSLVAVKTTDSGLVEAASGTLEFTQALAGKGAMKIDAGATLQVGNSAASTLTATFNGTGATLALSKVAKFASTISGFTTGETIDLLKTAATSATLNASDQLTIVNGATTVATLQLSGVYTGFVFNVASDGHGGSAITLAAGPGALPPTTGAFAQAIASVGGLSGAASPHVPVAGLTMPRELTTALAAGGHNALA